MRRRLAAGFIITTLLAKLPTLLSQQPAKPFLPLATVAVDVLTFSWREIQRKRVKVKTENNLSAIADELYLTCETRMGTQGKTEERDMERERFRLLVPMRSLSDRKKSSAKKKLSLTGSENSAPPFHDVAYYRCEKGDKIVTHIRYTAVNAPGSKSIHNIRTPISKSVTPISKSVTPISKSVTPTDPLRISKRQSSLYYTPENDIPNSLEEDSSSSEDEEEDSSSDYMKAVQERNKKKNQEALALLKKTAKALGDSKDCLMRMESGIHILFCAEQNSDGIEPKRTIDEIGCMVELLQSMMANFHVPSP